MTEANAKYILIGKVGATYGITGWLKIQAFTQAGLNILDYSPWYLSEPNNDYSEITIEAGKPHGKGIIVKFPGLDNPEEARLLTGKTISIKRSQLPELHLLLSLTLTASTPRSVDSLPPLFCTN